MKAVLASVGSRGDIQPLAVLGGALRARGHDVTLIGPPESQHLADDYGVKFVGNGRDIMAYLNEFDFKTASLPSLLGAFRDLVDKDMGACTPVFLDVAAGADVVVTASLQMLGSTVAEKVGAASTYLYFSPHLLPSDEHPPIAVEIQRLPKLANRAFHAVTLAFFNRVLLPVLNRERRGVGLAPYRTIVDSLPREMILAYDHVIAPPPTDLERMWQRLDTPARAVLQPGALVAAAAPLGDDLARFVDACDAAGVPCVYVGFGSMPDHTPADTLKLVDAAVAAVGARAVLLSKGAASTERVHVVTSTSHRSLFPRMRAVVHHGGAGTTAMASRSGAPQVFAPHFTDQPFWAYRLALAGANAGTIRRRHLNVDNLARALRRALDDAQLQERARALAAALNAVDSNAAFADAVEAVAAP